MVREWSAKPLCVSSILTRASNIFPNKKASILVEDRPRNFAKGRVKHLTLFCSLGYGAVHALARYLAVSFGVSRGFPMRSTALLLITLCCSTIVGMTQPKHASADEKAMTAGDLQEICTGSSAESKASCRFYLLGITQGISLGVSIADGKTQGGRPCIPENLSASAIELAVKMKMGQDLMVFPDDHKLDASGFVGAILVSTFPCRKPN